MKESFWLLEANWRGGNEHIDRFLTEGIWFNILSNQSTEFNKIKTGDIVAVKSSITKELDSADFSSSLIIKAIGTVIKNFNDGRRLEVKWTKILFQIDNFSKTGSIIQITDEKEIEAIFSKYKKDTKVKVESVALNSSHQERSEIVKKAESLLLSKNYDNNLPLNKPNFIGERKEFVSKKIINTAIKHIPLNQILYGLPGTGKTYNSMLLALEIIDGFFPENADEAKRKFNYYKDIGQIAMITFHNSYKYADFVEGISATLSSKLAGTQEHKIKDGIFKEIANIARAEIESFPNKIDFSQNDNTIKFFKASIGVSAKEKDNSSVNYCFENNYIVLDMLGGIDYSILEDTDDWEKAQDEIRQAYLYEGQNNDQIRSGIQSIYYFKNHMKKGDIVLVSNDNERVIAIAVIKDNYIFKDLAGLRYNHFRKVDWIIKDCSIPITKFYRKEFSEQPIYELSRRNIIIENLSSFINKNEARTRNYVLIVDEINKGDIYKIFGEIITLIDPEKRVGKREALKIKLPYSKDTFGVPDNLYLIGTMNFSEKTEILDPTLRRRFDFIKVSINYDLLNFKIDGIEIDTLLRVINQRIEYLTSEYDCIGHSYFLRLLDTPSLETLVEIFEHQINPLIKDIFKDDYKKIAMVFGDNKRKKNEQIFVKSKLLDLKKLFGKNFKPKDQKNVFYLDAPKSAEAYINIY